MQKRYLFAAVVAVAAMSTAAYAGAPRYDYVDLSYGTFNDPSGSNLSSDHAYGLGASYAITDNWLVGGSYSHESADWNPIGSINNGSATGNSYEAGLAYRIPLSDSVDLVPNLSYLSAHSSFAVDGFSSSSTNTGYDAGVLLRAMVTPAVELDANVDHTSPGSSGNDVGVAALYDFDRSFAVGLGYGVSRSNGQNVSGWSLALRYYFK